MENTNSNRMTTFGSEINQKVKDVNIQIMENNELQFNLFKGHYDLWNSFLRNKEINKLFTKEHNDYLLKNLDLKENDKIKIIHYGALIGCEKQLYLKCPEYPIYREYFVTNLENKTELYVDYDWKPELIGKEFIVEKQLGLYIKTKCGELFKMNQVEKINER
jgi:hypothetical protein